MLCSDLMRCGIDCLAVEVVNASRQCEMRNRVQLKCVLATCSVKLKGKKVILT